MHIEKRKDKFKVDLVNFFISMVESMLELKLELMLEVRAQSWSSSGPDPNNPLKKCWISGFSRSQVSGDLRFRFQVGVHVYMLEFKIMLDFQWTRTQ